MERVDHAHRTPVLGRQSLAGAVDIAIRVRRVEVETGDLLRGKRVFDPARRQGAREVEFAVGVARAGTLDRTGAIFNQYCFMYTARRS